MTKNFIEIQGKTTLAHRAKIFVAPTNHNVLRPIGPLSFEKTSPAMANTYTQLYTHIVFAVKHRNALIKSTFRDETEKYMTGLLQNKGHKLLAIYLMPDHAHILIGQNPKHTLSETVNVLKTETSKFIKDKRFTSFQFNWQEGYGAFSHSRSELDNVIKYILNQPEHHKTRTFESEYLALLKRFEVEFDRKFLFEFFEKEVE